MFLLSYPIHIRFAICYYLKVTHIALYANFFLKKSTGTLQWLMQNIYWNALFRMLTNDFNPQDRRCCMSVVLKLILDNSSYYNNKISHCFERNLNPFRQAKNLKRAEIAVQATELFLNLLKKKFNFLIN